MSISRGTVEREQPQGVDEEVVYTVTTTRVGSNPTGPVVSVADITNNFEDVTSTVMPSGSPAAVGDVITLPPLLGLTIRHKYRVDVQYTIDSGLVSTFFIVVAER